MIRFCQPKCNYLAVRPKYGRRGPLFAIKWRFVNHFKHFCVLKSIENFESESVYFYAGRNTSACRLFPF
jgi:hypothetical protein